VLESLFDHWRTQMIGVTTATDRTYGMSTTALTTALTPTEQHDAAAAGQRDFE